MRIPSIALALAVIAAPAAAQPVRHGPPVSEVTVTIGPDLAAKASDYGQRDLDMLASDLRRDMQQQLTRAGRMRSDGVRLRLEITNAKPNHPTFAQLGRTPGLDMLRSRSIGGASLRGEEIGPNGARAVSYSFWETDIRMERGASTWSDAERAFDTFAHDYAAGRR